MTRSNSYRRRARAAARARAERFDPRYPAVLTGLVALSAVVVSLALAAV